MKINISELIGKKLKKKSVELSFKGEEFVHEGDEIKFLDPINAHGEIISRDNIVSLDVNIQTKLSLPCSRCLKPFVYPINMEMNEKFSISDGEDENAITLDEEILDIPEMIKGSIVMALPIKKLCSENCKGLCQQCGANLNLDNCSCDNLDIDIRLAKLKELFPSD
ncbi:YceD family protein [Clostridium hydrogeniformans]|uniref:YceD family protein n=1 Tax=Clostridium hydrogeniformans TaxID=349933 RepID=UPI00048543D7|nr:YceD family protein [Clostridium hydrogeniformans]